ncbi:hypothetical protein EGM51_17790 [Verrucomicrobia bacterium S94]|nr:hypothetical protein EGM51_17790 [Verrucomicrobia bacterium S94]
MSILVIGSVSAVSTLAGKKADPIANYDRTADRHAFTVFMENGGWCWFQDPRAVLQGDYLVIGGVSGNGSGAALIGSYDLKSKKVLGSFVAKDRFNRDDHNSPAFYARPDGSLLAVYARHGWEKFHYFRISTSPDFTQWGPEQRIQHADFLTDKKDKVTYMNLYNMSAEGKLYNFYRGMEYNPTFCTSTDQGLSWSEDTHFIQSEVDGRNRPYARYAGNGKDTVYVSFTDGHPHVFGNNLYYAEFRGGSFYRADGTLIKSLKTDGPLRPSEAELIYHGSNVKVKQSTNAAWTSSMVFDAEGYPHIGYTVHLSASDLRYRIASWDGTQWHDREVAFGGKCLYRSQTSYTGLITLDPKDPSYVVISTDVDPNSGVDRGGKHEIYRAGVALADNTQTIEWEAVTKNSPVRNIRPIILNDGTRRVVLWNRGDYQSYTDYDLDTVGYEEKLSIER